MPEHQKNTVLAGSETKKNNPAIESIQILRDISKNPYISQREIAIRNRISLGKVNYALKSLLDRGYIKIQNFKNSKNKRQYAYLLTPAGMYEMAKRTAEFLKWKMGEYERIKREITELEEDILAHTAHNSDREAGDAAVSLVKINTEQ